MNCKAVLFFFIFISFCFFTKEAKANHIMGADIGWKYVAGDTFLFTASVYRSCDGLALSNSPFQYFSDQTGYTVLVTVYGSMCCTKDVTPYNPAYNCTRCSSPSCQNPFGIQLIVIQAKIVFPKGCCKWYVSWEQKYRDAAITTGAAGKNFYTEAEIDVCQLNPKDNSPTFNAPAVNIFCHNQCTTIDYGAVDIDNSGSKMHDSLFYSLVPPLEAHATPITYSKGYSYNAPLINFHAPDDTTGACASFAINKQTGALSFRTQQSDISVIAVQVDEYRPDSIGNLHKIGSVRRDIECFVSDCGENNHPPTLTGIKGATPSTIKICTEANICFTITGTDTDPDDTVKIWWDSTITGADFRLTGSPGKNKWPTAAFCWSPKKSDVRADPYIFTVFAMDNALKPIKISKKFIVYVIPAPEATYVANHVKCGIVHFQFSEADSSETAISSFSWTLPNHYSNGDPLHHDFDYQYKKGGIYKYNLLVTGSNGCNAYYADSVVVPEFPSVSLQHVKDTIVCEKSPDIVMNAIPGKGNPPYSFKWNTGETTTEKNAKISRDTFFAVAMTDAKGCPSADTMYIKYQKVPAPKPAENLAACWNEGTLLSSTLSSQVVWEKISGNNISYNYSTHNPLIVKDSGTYIVTAKNSGVCPGTDSFKVRILPKIPPWKRDSDLCLKDSFSIVPPLDSNIQIYFDDINPAALLDPFEAHDFIASTLAGYKFTVVTRFTRFGLSCTDTNVFWYHVHNKPKIKLGRPPDQCRNNTQLNLNPYIDKSAPGGFWFYPRNPAAIVGDYMYQGIMGTTDNDRRLGYLHYRFTNVNNCISEDSVRIIIYEKPFAGYDASIWRECGRYILNRNIIPLTGGTWAAAPGTPDASLQISGDTAYFNPDSVSGYGTYNFIYSYKAKTGSSLCDGSDTVALTLTPKAKIILNHYDTVCQNWDLLPLTTSISGGTWQMADSANQFGIYQENNKFSFIANYAGPGLHHLRYILPFDSLHPGCTDTAMMDIYVYTTPKFDFATADSGEVYCARNGLVRLIPDYPGGVFSGKGVVEINDTFYFNPAKGDQSSNRITYSLPLLPSKCIGIRDHFYDVRQPPEASLIYDSLMCGDNNVFTLKAIIKNVHGVFWRSVYNGQDGGNFQNQVFSDSLCTIQYIPGPEQLKQKEFTIYLTAWSFENCDTIHLEYKIKINPAPVPDFVSNREGCEPFTPHFKQISTAPAGRIVKYDWDFGNSSPQSFDSVPVYTYYCRTGEHQSFYDVTLHVTTNEGCGAFISKKNWIIAIASPKPVITATPITTTLDRPVIQFDIGPQSTNLDTSDTATRYEWHFGDTLKTGGQGFSNLKNPSYKYEDSGKYTVVLKVTNGNGCTGTNSEYNLIDIRPAFAIFIPNVFLPGTRKDGSRYINNIFKPVLTSASGYEMTIYNRWGELVFSTHNPDLGWDGNIKNSAVPDGVYIYNIKAANRWGEPHNYIGTLHLMR